MQAAFTADKEGPGGYVQLDYRPAYDYRGLDVQFIDQSTGPIVRWEWHYGTDFYPPPARTEDVFFTSTDPWGYYAPINGWWTITLTVYDADGCMDQERKLAYVRVSGCPA